jgi:hypothetical protein
MAIKGLEYEATEIFFDGTKEENNSVSLRSIALSLNRIADALHNYNGQSIADVLEKK